MSLKELNKSLKGVKANVSSVKDPVIKNRMEQHANQLESLYGDYQAGKK